MEAVAVRTEETPVVAPKVLVAATFAADPLLGPLGHVLGEIGLGLEVEIGPYGQIFQQLLDPASQFATNPEGINVVMVRFEDWLRGADGELELEGPARDSLERNVMDLGKALREAASKMPTPIVLCVCPASPAVTANHELRQAVRALEDRLCADAAELATIRVLPSASLLGLGVSDVYDPIGDRLGNVPYTPRFFCTIGLRLSRLIHALRSPSAKVLVLDCDNTLWKGEVGADGVAGIQITDAYRGIQEFALEKKRAGMVLCLASKNTEFDVVEVFEKRRDMVLRADDIVAMRVNWRPKSENIRSLAEELNLGLDSFVFVDDNPLECAEVEASCPGVLVLRLPVDEDPVAFLRNVWPLNLLDVTEEDGRRSDMYRENLARNRFGRSAGTLANFLAGLDLQIDIAPPTEAQLARVAQLTQRTNQFNFTNRRRSVAEIALALRRGTECRAVEVRDRFGNYGLVGVVLFEPDSDALVIDTFLLSCRVLGRGVEHAVLREIGNIARGRGLARVEALLIPTKRNLPARAFLESLDADLRLTVPEGTRIVFSVERACGVGYTPGDASIEIVDEHKSSDRMPQLTNDSRSDRWNRLARTLRSPDIVMQTLLGHSPDCRRTSVKPTAPPRTPTEQRLCAIWAEALNLPEVGIEDDYHADLGGTSLIAVTIFARIERELGARLPLATLVEAPTVSALAGRIDRPVEQQSLMLLHAGGPGVPLFLAHDADGEILLYRNLARRLGDRPIYGLRPRGCPEVPILHTRIQDMAAHYVAEIRKVRPHGPYLLGGLCAGGIVAYEMAVQLEDAGETARLVAVFDAADVEARRKPHLENRRRMDRIRQTMGGAGSPASALRALATKVRRYAVYQVASRTKAIINKTAVATLRFFLDRGLSLPSWARKVDVRTVYTAAEAEYRPRRALKNEIVLFRATAGDGPEEPYLNIYSDPLLGWGKRSLVGMRAFDVPGGHGSMLQEPYVAAISEILRNYLGFTDAAGSDDATAETTVAGGARA